MLGPDGRSEMVQIWMWTWVETIFLSVYVCFFKTDHGLRDVWGCVMRSYLFNVGQARHDSVCRKPSPSISIDYVSQPLLQHVSSACVRVCVWEGGVWLWVFVGGIWNAKLRELSITKITLLLTAPRRRWSIIVINKDRPVCQEAPISLEVWWQQQLRRFLMEDSIWPAVRPQGGSRLLIL